MKDVPDKIVRQSPKPFVPERVPLGGVRHRNQIEDSNLLKRISVVSA